MDTPIVDRAARCESRWVTQHKGVGVGRCLLERVAALGAAARGPIVVAAFGLAVGVAAFWASSFTEPHTYLGPVGVEAILKGEGHDPMTGQPYGRALIMSDAFMQPEVVTRRVVVEPPPTDMKPAIPVPVGTAVGVLVTLFIRRLDRRLSRPL
jgi:hypothetical protein